MKKLILIDGYSFLFRAFFAIKNLTRADGTPIGGLYGFTRMLMKIITEINYTHIAVVFDTGKKTFRNEIYSEYKANRPPCPPELYPQFPLVRDLVKVLNIQQLEKIGFEADDIIATYAKKAEIEGIEVMIVSSDKDLMQLVNKTTKMFDGMKNEIIDEAKVEEKWGVKPKQVLDVLSLTGDTSDNVPGVPSIGPKTASELINKYGNIDNLLKNLNEIKQIKKREALVNNIDNILLSKKLITLDENVEMDCSLENLIFKQYDYKELIKFLKEQEFYSMVKGLEQAFENVNIVTKNIPEENNEAVKLYKNIENIDQLNKILQTIKIDEKFYFNIFLEQDKVTSLTFSSNNKEIYFIKIQEETDLFKILNDNFTFNKIIQNFKQIFEDNLILKIGYNIKKQIKLLYNSNIVINNFEDIEVINYIANAGLYENIFSNILEYNLKINNVWYLEQEYKNCSIEEKIEIIRNIEKNHKNDKLNDKLFEVSCFIVESMKPLYLKLKDILIKNDLISVYENIERPMTKILANMEIMGVKIDVKKLHNLSIEFQNHINELSTQIYKIAGIEFNIASPKQLSEILFEKMKLNPIKKARKSGNFSTNVEILEELASEGCEICEKILIWRHYSKLKNTYTDVLPTLVDKNNRIHTTYSNTSVVTGRLSSNNPNLQNLPIKTEAGSKIRSAFISEKGYKLISADYKQAELRIIANYQNVEKLKEFFLEGKDIHKTTASKVFDIAEEDVTSEMRSIAKAINFSIIYGTSAYGLSKRINSSNEEAKKYLENYFKTYPEIKNYIDNIKKFVSKNNYVNTIFGRKINIDIANKKPIIKGMLERLAINAPIQGSASDIIKIAMINLDKKLEKFKSKIILQIHDELVLECPIEEVEEISQILKNVMETVVDWEVNLEVNITNGYNLEEM